MDAQRHVPTVHGARAPPRVVVEARPEVERVSTRMVRRPRLASVQTHARIINNHVTKVPVMCGCMAVGTLALRRAVMVLRLARFTVVIVV